MTGRIVRAGEIDPEITVPKNKIAQNGVSSRVRASDKDTPSLVSRDHISPDEMVRYPRPDDHTICVIHNDVAWRDAWRSCCSANGVANADGQIYAGAAIGQRVYAVDIGPNKVSLHEVIVNRGVVSSHRNRVTSTS